MYPYQDPNQPIEARIDDLLARMTTEEKIAQTDQYGSSDFTTVDETAGLRRSILTGLTSCSANAA